MPKLQFDLNLFKQTGFYLEKMDHILQLKLTNKKNSMHFLFREGPYFHFSFLILAVALFIVIPSYSNPTYEKNNFFKMRKRFQKIDKNGDGLLSKNEMMDAHRDRIDKLFMNFDENSDNKLSKKELRAVRQEMKKRIFKFRNEGE